MTETMSFNEQQRGDETKPLGERKNNKTIERVASLSEEGQRNLAKHMIGKRVYCRQN